MTAIDCKDQLSFHGPNSIDEFGRKRDIGVLCDQIQFVALGQDADVLGPRPSEAHVMVRLPMWLWTDQTQVGRKNRVSDGSRSLMPARMMWPDDRLVLWALPGEEMKWEARGPSFVSSGVITVAARCDLATPWVQFGEDTSTIPPTVAPMPGSLRRNLRLLHDQGKQSTWHIRELISNMLPKVIERAASSVAAEFERSLLLSETAIEIIETEIIYGSDTAGSALDRAFNGLLNPDRMSKVDPIKFISRSIGRDTRLSILRYLDDPREGRAIRSIARDHGWSLTFDELLEKCRTDIDVHIAPRRVMRAMSPPRLNVIFDYESLNDSDHPSVGR